MPVKDEGKPASWEVKGQACSLDTMCAKPLSSRPALKQQQQPTTAAAKLNTTHSHTYKTAKQPILQKRNSKPSKEAGHSSPYPFLTTGKDCL